MRKTYEDFQVFVKPVGARCNLACSYCYYLDKTELLSETGLQRMTDELLEIYIIQHIQASAGPAIFFSWHGGEPTLAGLNYFRRIIELQKKHLPENCRIVNGLQTNGTLLDEEWCSFLAEQNIIVGISLDGPKELHSISRCSKDGHPSFDAVLRGYRLLKKHGIIAEILCVVNSKNVSHPLRVYQFFNELQAEYITFLPLVEKDTTGEKLITKRTVSAKAFGEFLCTIFDEWKTEDIGKVKIQIFEEAIRTAFKLEHTLCIFKKTCGGVPVIEHNGDFYSCDHFVDSSHRIGNIRKTSLVQLLESREQKAFGQAKLNTLPDYCLSCEVLSMCNGACPKDRLIETPIGEPGLNYLCEGYKLFFNHCKPFVDEVAEAWGTIQSQKPVVRSHFLKTDY
jgi:uncharacterized protein